MVKKIFGTFATKIFNAVFMFAVMALSTQTFGDSGYGEISIILLSSAVIALFNDVFNSGVIFYASKLDTTKLMSINYAWVTFVALVGTGIIYFFNLASSDVLWMIFLIALFSGIRTCNEGFLVGRRKIKVYNLINILYTVLFSGLVGARILIFKDTHFRLYLESFIIGNAMVSVLSFYWVIQAQHKDTTPVIELVKKLFLYGIHGFSAVFMGFLTRRINYFLLDKFLGKAEVGRYSAAMQLSESISMFSRSVGMVNESETANSDSIENSVRGNIFLLKLTMLASALLMLSLILIPNAFYELLLGSDFGQTKNIIASFSVGIVSFAGMSVLNTFYGGIGKPKYINFSAFVGLVVTVVGGFLFIPEFGVMAAALVSSAGQFISLVLLVLLFKKQYAVPFRQFFITSKDIELIFSFIQTQVNKRK